MPAKLGSAQFRRIALFSVEDGWSGSHRLAREMSLAGAHVSILAPVHSYLAKSRYPKAKLLYESLESDHQIVDHLDRLVAKFRPRAIVPIDLLAFDVLIQIARGGLGTLALRRVIARSIPRPGDADRFFSNRAFLPHFGHFGCTPPDFLLGVGWEDILAFQKQHGWPIVLKVSGSRGGGGVQICQTFAEAAHAFGAMRGHDICVQRYIAGRVVGVIVAGHDGVVADSFAFLKQDSSMNKLTTGIVRHFEHEAVESCARRIFAEARMSGFACIDFIVDARERGWLLEMNVEIDCATSFGRLFGRNIVAAYIHALAGRSIPPRTSPEGLVAAAFPLLLRRDSGNPLLHSACHDVPHDDPDVLNAIIAREFNGVSPLM